MKSKTTNMKKLTFKPVKTKYKHIGVQGEHPEIKMFRAICQVNDFFVGEKIIEMLTEFNNKHSFTLNRLTKK